MLSIPVKKVGHDEYRGKNIYGLEGIPSSANRGHFFQRYYDEVGLRTRILDRLTDGRIVSQQTWGERKAGWFEEYERQWMVRGAGITCLDPILMMRNLRGFSDIKDLVGVGVECLAVRKSVEKAV